MTDEHRTKIRNSRILKCLIDHVEGKLEMTSTQVTAGLGLLRKVMPDLSQTDSTVTVKREATDYSREELAAILAKSHGRNGGAGADAEDGCDRESDRIH